MAICFVCKNEFDSGWQAEANKMPTNLSEEEKEKFLKEIKSKYPHHCPTCIENYISFFGLMPRNMEVGRTIKLKKPPKDD